MFIYFYFYILFILFIFLFNILLLFSDFADYPVMLSIAFTIKIREIFAILPSPSTLGNRKIHYFPHPGCPNRYQWLKNLKKMLKKSNFFCAKFAVSPNFLPNRHHHQKTVLNNIFLPIHQRLHHTTAHC